MLPDLLAALGPADGSTGIRCAAPDAETCALLAAAGIAPADLARSSLCYLVALYAYLAPLDLWSPRPYVTGQAPAWLRTRAAGAMAPPTAEGPERGDLLIWRGWEHVEIVESVQEVAPGTLRWVGAGGGRGLNGASIGREEHLLIVAGGVVSDRVVDDGTGQGRAPRVLESRVVLSRL